MRYLELQFQLNPYNEAAADVLAASLADKGCDSFLTTDKGLTAYIAADNYEETAIREAADETAATFSSLTADEMHIDFTCTEMPDENWNTTWETEHHFEPIPLPNGQLIQIIPRQAFGSGEHATTQMVLAFLCEWAQKGHDGPEAFSHATIIDAGCGTGILGIAALKLGAAHVFAYDIDEWSVRNAQENCAINGVEANIVLGNASVLAQAPLADGLLANINRNILLADLPAFAEAVNTGGRIILSGFYQEDIQLLTEKAMTFGLQLEASRANGDWRALLFKKVRART